MNTDQLVALCQRHHALLLTSDSDMVSIAVVGSPAAELMEALRFATQKRIDIECWSAERMEKHRQLTSQSHLPVVSQTHSTVDILNHTLQQAISQRASDIHIEPMEHTCQIRYASTGFFAPSLRFPPRWQACSAHVYRCWVTWILLNVVYLRTVSLRLSWQTSRSRFGSRRFPAAVVRKLCCVSCIRFNRLLSRKRLA